MKKYQRLVLIIISIISVGLFLVYRQQYNRLRHVLEVFNFFGTPCNVSELQRSDGLLLEHDWGPQPIWQEVDSKGFIYSAFLLQKNKVQGLGVRHASVAIPKSCFLFFEDGNKPVKGKLSVSKISEDKSTGFVAYTYTCVFSFIVDKHPYALAFKSQSGPKYVSTLITNNLDKKVSFNSTICVYPSQFSKKSVLEFLSFHNLLGVESFIMYYEQNFSYTVIKLLKNLSNILNMWISFFPYNLPLFLPKNFTRILLEYDCEFRTKAHSKYSLILNINDYVVPPLDSVNSPMTRLPIKKFCLNHMNKNKPMILQNFESVDDYNFNDIVRLNKNNISAVTRKFLTVFDNNCVIYKYEKCEKGIKTKTDFSMKRFSTDLTRSTLVQLLMHDEV